MSVFSRIRESRQQAQEHKVKLAHQKRREQVHAPYKHVPTHAAIDALASAPPSWREFDRPRILEQNRRRSAMAADHHHWSGVPRIGSGLSHVSYPAEHATPVVRLLRNNSHSGVFIRQDGSRQAVYSSSKGKELAGREPNHDGDPASPPPSKGEPSPIESANGSQDHLEMAPLRPQAWPARPIHRLHPSRDRRDSDDSVDRMAERATSKAWASSGLIRDSRPPPSMRGFTSIAQVTSSPPMDPGLLAAPAGRSSRNGSSSSSSIGTLTPRRSSVSSLPALSPCISHQAGSAAGAPPPETYQPWTPLSHGELKTPPSTGTVGAAQALSQPRTRNGKAAPTLAMAALYKPVRSNDAYRAERGRHFPPSAAQEAIDVLNRCPCLQRTRRLAIRSRSCGWKVEVGH